MTECDPDAVEAVLEVLRLKAPAIQIRDPAELGTEAARYKLAYDAGRRSMVEDVEAVYERQKREALHG